MKFKQVSAILLVLALGTGTASAQFLNKLKQKAENAIDKKMGINQNQTSGNSTPVPGTSGSNGTGNPANNTGGGLISTPPDVKQNLSDAETSYKSSGYADARHSVQQAMLGVELEIGNQILKSLPASISGLDKIDKDDQVASSGFGWAGLVIARKYSDSKNKAFNITVANNAAMMSAVNMYLNGGFAQQSGGQQNIKQTKLKTYRALIQYDQGSGYKLSVPIGQSTLVEFDGINFATEQDMMTAAGTVDIEAIKKQLGEQ